MKKYKEDSMSKFFFFLINLKSVFEERVVLLVQGGR